MSCSCLACFYDPGFLTLCYFIRRRKQSGMCPAVNRPGCCQCTSWRDTPIARGHRCFCGVNTVVWMLRWSGVPCVAGSGPCRWQGMLLLLFAISGFEHLHLRLVQICGLRERYLVTGTTHIHKICLISCVLDGSAFQIQITPWRAGR